jgi:hypothetical protein
MNKGSKAAGTRASAAEIDNPQLLIERIRRASGAPDAIDVALRDLLGE